MTYEEAAKVLAVIKSAYPASYRDLKKKDAEAMVSLWAKFFEAEPYELVSNAVCCFIADDTKGFPPIIGQIKDIILHLMTPEQMTEQEAWDRVRQAVAHGGLYSPAEEYAKLPPEIQRAVGSPSQLREWAVMDVETFNSVVASNFMRSFRVIRKRNDDQKKLPPQVQSFIAGIADNLKPLELEESYESIEVYRQRRPSHEEEPHGDRGSGSEMPSLPQIREAVDQAGEST